MGEEGEMEIIQNSGVPSAGFPNQNSTPGTGPLVEVTFQRDLYQKNKYLEAEPKALGMTQITLAVFIMSVRSTSWVTVTQFEQWTSYLFFDCLVLFGVIAGSVAIAAQNLHLPTLKACLGVQVVMCVLSVIFFMDNTEILLGDMCSNNKNMTSDDFMCHRLQVRSSPVLLSSAPESTPDFLPLQNPLQLFHMLSQSIKGPSRQRTKRHFVLLGG